jgi:hypothetical protein
LGIHYHLFGLLLHSNLPLPGVTPAIPLPNSPDVELHLGVSPYAHAKFLPDGEELRHVSTYSNETGDPEMRVWGAAKGALLRIAYFDGTQFWLDRKRENLWATWPAGSSLEHALTYLLGPVLGILLRLRGVTCLHASAVAVEDRAVAFVGPAGAGKSTTAAAFARKRYRVLSDDIAALVERDGAFHLMPAYPHICLWPDSVRMLYGSSEALPRFVPDWEKRRLVLGEQETRFECRPLPLGAIYVLGERCAGRAPLVQPMPPQSALLSLITDTYANSILDRDLRAREFAVLGQLVSTIPVRRVSAHTDTARIGEFCRAIRDDFEMLESQQAMST